MKSFAEYRGQARENLKGNWGTAILMCVIVAAVSVLLGMVPVVGSVLSVLFAGQFIVVEFIYFIKLNNKQPSTIGSAFEGFGQNWLNNFMAYLLQTVFTILWFLLFIIPGIVKKYAYSMTLFLKVKSPKLEAKEAIALSTKMMNGKKWELCCLEFSFVGWIILSVLTFGIGFLFVAPYMKATTTAFYEDVYNEYLQKVANEIVVEKEESSEQEQSNI